MYVVKSSSLTPKGPDLLHKSLRRNSKLWSQYGHMEWSAIELRSRGRSRLCLEKHGALKSRWRHVGGSSTVLSFHASQPMIPRRSYFWKENVPNHFPQEVILVARYLCCSILPSSKSSSKSSWWRQCFNWYLFKGAPVLRPPFSHNLASQGQHSKVPEAWSLLGVSILLYWHS